MLMEIRVQSQTHCPTACRGPHSEPQSPSCISGVSRLERALAIRLLAKLSAACGASTCASPSGWAAGRSTLAVGPSPGISAQIPPVYSFALPADPTTSCKIAATSSARRCGCVMGILVRRVSITRYNWGCEALTRWPAPSKIFTHPGLFDIFLISSRQSALLPSRC